jgi:hypothetical protein
LGFATVDERTLIRILFPGLVAEGRNVHLNDEEKRSVYEDGILPSLREIAPENAANWAPLYAAAAWRAAGRGGPQIGTHPFPGYSVPALGDLIIQKLQRAHQWASGMRFMIQIRGVKEAHKHNPTARMANFELDRLLDNFDHENGQWFVDVGYEIAEPGFAYLWRTDAHSRIVEAVAGLDEGAARQQASPARRTYKRDINAHLVDISGFRMPLSTPALRGQHQIHYIQAYTTDKALTYHLQDGRYSKTMTGTMALSGNPPDFISSLYAAFSAAAQAMDVIARLEVRVPLRHARDALMHVEHNFLEDNLIVIRRNTWW